MSNEVANKTESLTKRCLYCLEKIPQPAKKCRFCGEWQMAATAPQIPSKSFWEKLEIVGRVIGLLLIPIIIALLGNSLNTALKKSDVDLRMVEVAVDILKTEPSDSNKEIRQWAIEVINKHSQVALTKEAKKELQTNPLFKLFSNVTIRTVDDEGREVNGYKIFYAPSGFSDDPEHIESFPTLSSPVSTQLRIGRYTIWWRKNDNEGPKEQIIVIESAMRHTLSVPHEKNK